MITGEQRQEFFDVINSVLDADFNATTDRAITKVEEDKILAVCVFNHFSKFGCEVNLVSFKPGSIDEEFLRVVCDYVFNKCNLNRVTSIAREDNERCLRLQKRIGMVEEARLKGAYGEFDGIMCRMLKDECKWL